MGAYVDGLWVGLEDIFNGVDDAKKSARPHSIVAAFARICGANVTGPWDKQHASAQSARK